MNSQTCSKPPETTFREARRAFTLLEILVVLAIIGMLVGLAVSALGNAFDNAKKDIAKTFVTTQMPAALGVYRIDMGTYPSTAEGLSALITAPASNSSAASWRGPYITNSTIPVDPWKKPYEYAYPGTHTPAGSTNVTFDVWSNGPTGQEGDPGTIGSWMQ